MTTERALVVKADRKRMDELLSKDDVRRQIMAAIPKHMDAGRLCRQAITLLSLNPGLMQCSDVSMLGGIIRAGELGLELSGPLGQAYLVPRWNKAIGQQEACFQLGYKGVIALAHRSGRIASVHMRTVYANDSFEHCFGTTPHVRHIPTREEPGEATHFYAVAFFKGEGFDFEVLTAGQARDHGTRFAAKNPMWKNHFEMMAQKTAMHRLGKRLPMAVELQAALAEDEENGRQGPDDAFLPSATGPKLTKTDALLQQFGEEPGGDPEPGAEDDGRD